MQRNVLNWEKDKGLQKRYYNSNNTSKKETMN